MKRASDIASASLMVVFALAVALALATQAHGAGNEYLSSMGQEVFEELNLARTQPKRYAEFLTEMRQHFNGKRLQRPGRPTLMTQEGVAAVNEAIRFLRSTEPLPALELSKGLSLAAQAHVKDQQDGALGHSGSEGSKPWNRMNQFGTWQGEVAENIAYGAYSARGVVSQLIIDDGVPDRGHRENIFNPDFRYVGVACGPHARFARMCVMDFAVTYKEQSAGTVGAYAMLLQVSSMCPGSTCGGSAVKQRSDENKEALGTAGSCPVSAAPANQIN